MDDGTERRGWREGRKTQVRGSRGGPPAPHQHPGLTRQHKPPHQHHVPGVLANVCRRLQRLQQSRGSRLLEQKPEGRQFPGGHNGEVDATLQEDRQ